MKKHTILFLAANPNGTDRLALGQQAHSIQAELERSGHGTCFKFVTRWAVEPLDLLRELRRLRPVVVHFSGHGSRSASDDQHGSADTGRDISADLHASADGQLPGLCFQAADGRAHVVSATALQKAFDAAGSSVKLVVLNACYSDAAAEALLAHVECVVGMAGTIHDDAARNFAIGFYGGLAERESVEAAYRQGRAAISLEGLQDVECPQLRVRNDIDPCRFVVASDLHAASRSGRGNGTMARYHSGIRHRSTVKSTEGEPWFTGREAELDAIGDKLQARRVVVIHGAPGLGKSRLAKEYAHKHIGAYPGGTFFVPFHQLPPTDLAKLSWSMGRSGPAYPDESIEDQCRRVLRELGTSGRTLLIYDAIPDERALREWLPYDGSDWHVIATTTSASWATSWSTLDLGPLQPAAARDLAASILGDDIAGATLAEAIAVKAAGVTIELCASAAATHERLRRGRAVERVSAELARETTSSFESAWSLLSSDARLVLQVASTFVTPHVPVLLIVSALQRVGWEVARAENAIDDARDRRLAGGDGEHLDVHQLVTRFVRTREPLSHELRHSLFIGLLEIARSFSQHPGDLDRRALLQVHSLCVDVWAALVANASEWRVVGDALRELGVFDEARRWFERAVAAEEKGDMQGGVDVASLGLSLYDVGYCYASSGQFEQAIPWFERAVAACERTDMYGGAEISSLGVSLHEAGHCYASLGCFEEAIPWFERAAVVSERGDAHGRVDASSLGTSLHEVGSCHANLGRFAQALPWFDRAVAAKEKGDVHGRVNFVSLGKSLHQVGYCHSRLNKFEDALPWFERAVGAKEKGDVHGRVDPESLGKSLHQVGYCYWSMNDFAKALPWFERAVAAAEKGDVHGHVNLESLGASLHQVGYCYSCLGKFAEALPWFQQALNAKDKGDAHGRVDFESVGRSLHRIGECHGSLGKVTEALSWYERAVAAKEKGDVHGRVNAESLGRSLLQIGDCHAKLDRPLEALSWFKRSVTAAEKGDMHGRVDHESLGNSLHRVGECYASQERLAEALPWFERAVIAKERGNIHGRVDLTSLGRSLHQAGYCCASLGEFDAARTWFERAASIKIS